MIIVRFYCVEKLRALIPVHKVLAGANITASCLMRSVTLKKNNSLLM